MKRNNTIKLKEIVEYISLTPLVRKSDNGNIRLLKPSAIEDGHIIEERLELVESKGSKSIEEFFLRKGDIVFQSKGNKFETILIDKDYENLVTSQMYFNIRINPDLINPVYLTWYLNNRISKNYFSINSSGSTVSSIKKKILEDIKIRVPKNLKDQTLICELIHDFQVEKEKTLSYLEKKEFLVNEKIIKAINGGDK